MIRGLRHGNGSLAIPILEGMLALCSDADSAFEAWHMTPTRGSALTDVHAHSGSTMTRVQAG